MTLRSLSVFVILLCASVHSFSQMVWNPKWQKGKTEMLEYNSSKHDYYLNSRLDFDTAHAIIKVRETNENEFFYFLEWKFMDYFEDTSKAVDNSSKIIYISLQRLMVTTSIQVRIDKSDFEVVIMNRDKLDSVQKVITAQVAETYPNKRDKPDAQLEEVVNMLVSLKAEDKIYSLISDYYGIYSVNGIEPGIKHMLNNDDGQLNDSTVVQIHAASNEFYILDDKDPQFYKWRYESKTDWSKMPANAKESIIKKGSMQSFGDVITDITINKADKLVTLFHSVSDDGNSPVASNRREVVERTIHKIN